MMLQVHAEARMRTSEIFECWEDMKAGFGEEFLRELEASYLKIEERPHQFPRMVVPVLHDRDIRCNLLSRLPFKIVYEIRADDVVVLAVVDGH